MFNNNVLQDNEADFIVVFRCLTDAEQKLVTKTILCSDPVRYLGELQRASKQVILCLKLFVQAKEK